MTLQCDTCRLELPVVTHWSADRQTFEYLASDQPVLVGTSEPPYTPGGCHYEYHGEFLPDYNLYLADRYAQTAIDDETARAFVTAAYEDTGVIIDLLRPDAFTSKDKGLGRLHDSSGAVQILHAKIIDGSLATIILPPNWSAEAEPGTYPIAFNGFYDLNANLFTQEGPLWVRMIATSGLAGRSGAIGVLWNGGGATAGRTTNEAAYRQFNAVISYVAQEFGGNRHRILMSGGSRGGLTAANMASNPYGYDYTVIFAAVTATPTLLGDHALLTSTTYPPLLPSTAWSVGLSDSWRTGWTYPACAGRQHLTGLTGPEAHLYILTKTSKIDEGNAMHSLMGERFLQGLKRAGTRLFLTVTEKDDIVPYNTQAQYAQTLMDLGIPLHIEVLLRGGHTERMVDGAWGETFARRAELVDHVMALVEDGQLPASPTRFGAYSTNGAGPVYYAANRSTGVMEPVTPDDGMAPFSLDVPYVTARGMRYPVVVTGHPGTAYVVTLTDAGGEAVVTRDGVIPPEQTTTYWVAVPENLPVGTYTYGLRIKKPGRDWVTIPETMTPSGDPATLRVDAEEPNIGPWETPAWCAAPKLDAEGVPRLNTNWGLTEY